MDMPDCRDGVHFRDSIYLAESPGDSAYAEAYVAKESQLYEFSNTTAVRWYRPASRT